MPIPDQRPSLKRPFGVWFLTIWLALFAGVTPISFLLWIRMNESARQALSLPGFSFWFSIVLAIAIMISAYYTWRGHGTARYLLVCFAIINYGLIAINNFQAAIQNPPIDSRIRLIGRVVRSLIWIVIVAWYFLGSRSRAYFNRLSADGSNQAGELPKGL